MNRLKNVKAAGSMVKIESKVERYQIPFRDGFNSNQKYFKNINF